MIEKDAIGRSPKFRSGSGKVDVDVQNSELNGKKGSRCKQAGYPGTRQCKRGSPRSLRDGRKTSEKKEPPSIGSRGKEGGGSKSRPWPNT